MCCGAVGKNCVLCAAVAVAVAVIVVTFDDHNLFLYSNTSLISCVFAKEEFRKDFIPSVAFPESIKKKKVCHTATHNSATTTTMTTTTQTQQTTALHTQ